MLRPSSLLAIPALLVSLAVGCDQMPDPADQAQSDWTAEDELADHRGADLMQWPTIKRIDARAGFSCDFEIAPGTPMDIIAPTIERDRMYLAEQPGLIEGKHLPLSINFETGQMFSGGRYLFDKGSNAASYEEFVTDEFVLDDVQFLEREDILDPSCRDWINIGAFELGDIQSDHILMRTERWHIPYHGNFRSFLRFLALPGVLFRAVDQGQTGVWMLYNREEQLVEIVQIADRVAPPAPGQLDVPSFFALQSSPTLGVFFDHLGFERDLTRTSFILSIWFPFVAGDQGEPSLWPNSPPLPEPFCGDGVCQPSRGEDGASCESDCPINCGDATCQPGEGEGTDNCPGDCRLD